MTTRLDRVFRVPAVCFRRMMIPSASFVIGRPRAHSVPFLLSPSRPRLSQPTTTMAAPLYTTSSGRLFHAGLIFIPLVGLPARGKTHIARSLERYLRWLGVKTRVFSLGDYRRKVLGGANVVPEDYFDADAKSPETIALRKKIKDGVEDQVWDFFSRQGGQVVIYDANNGDRASRRELYEKFEARGVHVIFLGESDVAPATSEATRRSEKGEREGSEGQTGRLSSEARIPSSEASLRAPRARIPRARQRARETLSRRASARIGCAVEAVGGRPSIRFVERH